mgnify:CR=1 FL=1
MRCRTRESVDPRIQEICAATSRFRRASHRQTIEEAQICGCDEKARSPPVPLYGCDQVSTFRVSTGIPPNGRSGFLAADCADRGIDVNGSKRKIKRVELCQNVPEIADQLISASLNAALRIGCPVLGQHGVGHQAWSLAAFALHSKFLDAIFQRSDY